MHTLTLLASLLVLVLTATQAVETTAAPDPWKDLDQRLVELMRAGIETTEPHGRGSKSEGGAPFDGSWDWHSSVIAHWALLNHARRTDDATLAAWVLERVTVEVVAEQGAYLAGRDPRRRMVFPYDEGWFGLLLSELAQHRPETEDVRALRAELEGRLLEHLESEPFPENLGLRAKHIEAGQERYCGFYRSSLFLFLQMSWSDLVCEDAPGRLAAWRRDTLEPRREAIAAITAGSGYDFLWVPALLALVDQLDGEPGSTSARPEPMLWPDSITIQEVHVLGRELCAVWPLAAGSEAERERYRGRVATLLQREDLWAEDFMVCSHWIPQYLFLGEWLAAGRP